MKQKRKFDWLLLAYGFIAVIVFATGILVNRQAILWHHTVEARLEALEVYRAVDVLQAAPAIGPSIADWQALGRSCRGERASHRGARGVDGGLGGDWTEDALRKLGEYNAPLPVAQSYFNTIDLSYLRLEAADD